MIIRILFLETCATLLFVEDSFQSFEIIFIYLVFLL